MRKVFQHGRILITRDVLYVLSFDDIEKAFTRYKDCDWGDTDVQGKAMNDAAVEYGTDRIVATYRNAKGIKFYIFTEADQSETTIYLPGDI